MKKFKEQITTIRAIEIHHHNTTPFEVEKITECELDEGDKTVSSFERLIIKKNSETIVLEHDHMQEPQNLIAAINQLLTEPHENMQQLPQKKEDC